MVRRGEMGVGTLIIFIALLLVAAVAAGVLIQTAGSLQQKALSTGSQATSQISTNAQVLEVAATDGLSIIENVTVLMKLAPGSSPIDFATAMVTFDTVNTTTSYRYSGSSSFLVNASAENGTFGITYLQTGTNSQTGLLVRGDIVELSLQSPRSLDSGEEVRFSFIPQTGTPTRLQFAFPDVLATRQVYVYP